MESPPPEHLIERFVLKLLATGSMLSELVSDLFDARPVDTYPGEAPAAVVVEMLRGTIAAALASLDEQDVRRATELMELAGARVLEHMQLGHAISRRIHGDGEGGGRTYG